MKNINKKEEDEIYYKLIYRILIPILLFNPLSYALLYSKIYHWFVMELNHNLPKQDYIYFLLIALILSGVRTAYRNTKIVTYKYKAKEAVESLIYPYILLLTLYLWHLILTFFL